MNVQIGSTGSDVVSVQTALQNLGWNNVNIDGQFGPITQQAVVDFQYLSGLNPNGIVDDITFGGLQQAIGQQIVNSGGVPYNAILPAVPYMPSVGTVTNPTTMPTGTPGATTPTVNTSTSEKAMDTTTAIGIAMLGVTLLLVAKKSGYI